MQEFGLIGQHPDGVAMALALERTGLGRLAAYAGPTEGADLLARNGLRFDPLVEVETLLARRDLDAVIVADDLEHRPLELRRAAQSDLDVLCVHPCDLLADAAYEAAMIQQETGKLLLPLLPFRLTPGLERLQGLARPSGLGPVEIVEAEFCLGDSPPQAWDQSPLVWLWDILRGLGGEIRELAALSTRRDADIGPADPLTLNGRFEEGGLFRVLVAGGRSPERLLVRGGGGQAELILPGGWRSGGPHTLAVAGGATEEWPEWSPWDALARAYGERRAGRPSSLTWQNGTRCLELLDAARKSAKKQRMVPLHYEEFSEEATFKSMMTGLGCSLLFFLIVLLFAAPWAPWLLYGVLPVLLLFLFLQVFRWAARPGKNAGPPP